jgi:flagellar protein FliS
MSDKPQNEYLKAKILTATPEQLQTMLFDGAIRFAEQAKQAIADGDVPAVYDRTVRAQRIVLELSSSMNVEVNPELCGKLASLYNYLYRLLVEANLKRDVAKLDEALDLLRYQRETWQMALQKAREEAAGVGEEDEPSEAVSAAGARDAPAPAPPSPTQPTPGDLAQLPPLGGTLSVEG